MATYLSLKSILMAAAIIGAFSLFFIRVRRLVRLMTTVQGRTDATVDRLADRFRVFCTDVLGQANVRRSFCPGFPTC